MLFTASVVASSAVATGADLDGTWFGRAADGSTIVWQLDGGRLRLAGRPADVEIHDDSLIVRFDSPPRAGVDATRETAVYRYLMSSSTQGFRRLFVYGFDLGRQGMYLEREEPTPPEPPEDTTPAVPEPSGSGKAASRSITTPGAQARADR